MSFEMRNVNRKPKREVQMRTRKVKAELERGRAGWRKEGMEGWLMHGRNFRHRTSSFLVDVWLESN